MLVCVATYEYITVELSLHCSESLHVTPRNNLVSVDDPNLKVVDLHYLCFWQARLFVAVTLYDMRLTFCGCQVLKPLNHLNAFNREKFQVNGREIVTSLEPTFPGQMTCYILPGMRRSLNCSGREAARCGMWISPMIRTNSPILFIAILLLTFKY